MSNAAELKQQLKEAIGRENYHTYVEFLNKWYPNWKTFTINLKGTFEYDDEHYSPGGEMEFLVKAREGGYTDPQLDGLFFNPFGQGDTSDQEPAMDWSDSYRAEDKFFDDAFKLPLESVHIERIISDEN